MYLHSFIAHVLKLRISGEGKAEVAIKSSFPSNIYLFLLKKESEICV